MADFKSGAEPGKILRRRIGTQGDQLRFVVERAGIGVFDRDNAVLETWQRWGEGGAEFSFPISTRPPAGARAGVIDVNIRVDNVTVAQAVEDAEKVAGFFANVVSVAPLTRETIQAGATERETVRQKAIEEGAGAGFTVITRPITETLKTLERGAKTVLVVGLIGVAGFVVFQLSQGKRIIPARLPT